MHHHFMKLIIFLLVLTTSSLMYADCGSFEFVYPKEESISRNSKFIFEYGGYFSRYVNLGEEDQIYLYSSTDTIRLIKEAKNIGNGLGQIIFKPARLLNPDEIYYLQTDSKKLLKNLRIRRNPSFMRKQWFVDNIIDIEAPHLLREFEFCETSLIQYGCGPSMMTKFNFDAMDASEIFVQVELKNLHTDEISMMFVKSKEGILTVGRGMCGGHFKFTIDCEYSIRFKLFDINGNSNQVWSNWMDCPNPWNN